MRLAWICFRRLSVITYNLGTSSSLSKSCTGLRKFVQVSPVPFCIFPVLITQWSGPRPAQVRRTEPSGITETQKHVDLRRLAFPRQAVKCCRRVGEHKAHAWSSSRIMSCAWRLSNYRNCNPIHRNQLPRPGEGLHCRAGRPLSKACSMQTRVTKLREARSPVQSRKQESSAAPICISEAEVRGFAIFSAV